MFKIGNKIVEAFCSKRVVSENKTIHTPHLLPRSTQSWGVCCFIQVVQTAVQHCMEGIGEEKLYSPFLKSVKIKKPHLVEVSQLILLPIVA